MSDFKVREDCRLCGHKDLVPVLHLEPTPPANEFVSDPSVQQDVFDLDVHMCGACGHVQLPTVVSPERLFRNYVYVSGTSPVFVQHFRDYALEISEELDLKEGELVVEVGSNDGTLLRCFKDRGLRVLGVDPAKDIASRATESGIPTIPEFFTPELAHKIEKEHGKAQLVVANNVYAHVDDMFGLTLGIADLLGPGGVFTFEVSYLVDVLEKTLFDTVYHEHLSYHSVGPLLSFFPRAGMRMFDARRIPTHGGSMRGYVCRSTEGYGTARQDMHNMLASERGLGLYAPGAYSGVKTNEPFFNLWRRVSSLKEQLTGRIRSARSHGKTVAAFGAPAKATTLMYQFDLGPDAVDFVVDDSPLKQGLYTPGKHVPVLPSSALYERRPDMVVVLAWNFADSIVSKHRRYMDEGGKFVVPLPSLVEHTGGGRTEL